MTKSKFYRVLSLVLAFVMTVSLFSNWTMPIFATSGVKSKDLTPVISTTLKGEITLYSDVKDGAPSVDITCEEEINVELYKKFVVEETGKVFYGFYVTDKVSDDLAEIFEDYHFISAAAVGLPESEFTQEPTVEPILDTPEYNLISNNVTTGNFNVDEEGNYYIAHTTGIIVKSADEKMATVRNIAVEPVSKANGNIPVGSADYLIWNNSLFCDITLTDENGNEVYLDGTVDVIFPKDIVPFKVETDHTKSYYTYRFDDDGTVYSNGIYEYKPDTDLVATYDGLSVVGFAAIVFEKNNSYSSFAEPFEVVSKGTSINLYSNAQLDQTIFKNISVGSTDKFTVDSKITVTDGINEVELYYVAIGGYTGGNNAILDLINGNYPLIRVSDVEKYVEPRPTPIPTPVPEQPDEVVNAYNNLLKAPTLADFEECIAEILQNGYHEQFTDDQMAEIDRIGNILTTMGESTENWEEFNLTGTVSVKGSKLYLNPVTWPEEYVIVNTDSMIASLDVNEVWAEYAPVKGEYIAENGDAYYVIDTSAWASFAGKTPYKYINKENFIFNGDWTRVSDKGYFLSDEIRIYDGTGRTYRRIDDGLSKGAFDVLYSFFTDNGDGTITEWYVINTTGWTDVNGSTFKNKLVKQADVKLITPADINTVYNNILHAASVDAFDALYGAAQAKGIIDCFTDEQKHTLAAIKTTLVGMADETEDLSQFTFDAAFTNKETKLYPNPVTNPGEYITAVVEQSSVLENLLSTIPLFFTVYAAEGEQVVAQEIVILGKYLDGDTLYYLLDVSGWNGLPEGIGTLYVKASEIDIFVDEATQTTFVDLLSAQSGEQLADMLAGMDANTIAVMTEAGLIDLAQTHADVLEFLAENGSTPITDESVIGMYAQLVEGTQTVYLYANPNQFTDGMTYYELPSDEFKTLFKIVDVLTNEFGKSVYYKMDNSYPAKDGENPCSWIRADAVEILTDYIDPAEALYIKLMQTETLEEWHELVESFTDSHLQLLENLDETMSTELDKHFDSLPCAIDKEKSDAMDALLSAETVAEYLAIKAAMTEQTKVLLSGSDYIAMHNRIVELVDAEDTSPKDVVDYTNSAPMVIPDYTEIQEAAVYNLRNRMLMAAATDDGESSASTEGTDIDNPVIKDTAGVVTNKTVTLKGDGVYTINLETYVTGAKVTTAVEKQIPTDIIIVVDQSGSMEFDMNKSITYDRINGTAEEVYTTDKYADKVYVNVGTADSPVYKKVTMTAEEGETYVLASSLGYTQNYLLKNQANENNLYYKESPNNNPVQVTITTTGGYGNTKYNYSIAGVNTDSDNGQSWNYTPSFLAKLYVKSDTITKVTFSYKDAADNTVTKEYLPTDSVPKDSDNIVGNTYYYQNVSTSEYRLDALVRALNNFAASVEEKAKGEDGVWGINSETNKNDDVNHRIAIVGFSSSVNTYQNTEILTGCDITTGSSHSNEYGVYYPYGVEKNGVMYDSDNYAEATRTALVSMDTTAGQTSVENAIKALTAHGGTQTNHGLDMVTDIFAAENAKGTEYTRTENGKTVTVRNKVVILFTDGSPTSSSGFENNVANSAIGYAKTIKNTHNATLYSVGIFDGADGRVLTNTDKTNAYLPTGLSSENKFMHFVSSNFKNAENMSTNYDTNNGTRYSTETFHKESSDPNAKYTGKSYYLSASNSEALSNIFQTISEDSVTNATVVELKEETVVKDIVAPNFNIPAQATDITVSKAKFKGIKTNGDYEFETAVSTGLTAKLTDYDQDGVNDSVDVKGFNFADNWVGTETASNGQVTYRGYKLIITFDITVDEDFMGGNKVKTNGNNSGVYDDTGALVENFNRPTFDIDIKNITATWQNQYIYRTNNANIKDLFLAAKVNNKNAADVIDGTNNAYVNIEFLITGPDGEIAKYTIPAGKAFAEGGWSDESKLTPTLPEDAQYTLSWIVSPIYPGTKGEQKGSATATVFVYDPVLTFEDSTGYYGGTVPDLNDTDNRVGTTTWVNKNNETFDATKMHGTEPTLVPTYTAGKGVSNGVIITKSDIPVNVMVKVGNTDITNIVEFEHVKCANDENLPLFSGEDKAELLIHVNTATLTISKTVDAQGAPTPTETFDFTVTQGYSSEFPAEKLVYNYTIYNVGSDNPAKSDVIYAGAKGIALKHNQYAVLTGLPLGTYTVIEEADSRYTTTSTGAAGELTATAPSATAQFVNKLNAGSLTVTKTVEALAGFQMPTEKFSFTVKSKDGSYSNTFELANGESKTIEKLVVGEYTITEVLSDDQEVLYTAVNDGKVTVEVEPGKNTSATITNRRNVADLEVKKTVTTPDGIDKTADEFTFKVYITGAVEGGSLTVGQQTVTILKDDNGTYIPLTLKHNQTAVIKNLPVTIAFEVVETVVSGYTATANGVVSNRTSGTLPQTGLTGDNAVVFKNTLDTGRLTISKTVVPAPGVSIPKEEFVFTVDVNNVAEYDKLTYTVGDVQKTATVDKNGDVTIRLAHGQTAVFANLPIGAVIVTETEKEQFTTTVNGVKSQQFTGTIVAYGTANAAYINTVKTYSLTINKAFAVGTTPEEGETFVFNVTNEATGFSKEVVIAVVKEDNELVYKPVTITGLPAGTYKVEEDMSWSKQYTADSQSTTVEIVNSNKSVTVTNSKTDKWLKAYAYVENIFGTISESKNNPKGGR